MRSITGVLAALVAAAWLAACAALPAPPAAPLAQDEGPLDRAVFVVSNGWHAGIVIAASEITASGLIPEAADFPGAAFYEFGWGDREYYPAPDSGLWLAIAAALTSTPAVVHLQGLARPPREAYAEAEVVAVPVSAAGLERLIARLDAAFDREGAPRAEAVAPGLYANSLFYPAHGTFHLNNTCNTWVGRKLQAARPDLSPAGVQTAESLMRRVRALEGAKGVQAD
jgi:uncharacterized protein (TIGR02117 family)